MLLWTRLSLKLEKEIKIPKRSQRRLTFIAMQRDKEAAALAMPGWSMISQALNDVVKQCGLPVAVVAGRAGMARQYLYAMMNGRANPTMEQLEKAFAAAGTPLAHWLSDRALYGRDKAFHDRVQNILNKKGPRAIALPVIVEDGDA